MPDSLDAYGVLARERALATWAAWSMHRDTVRAWSQAALANRDAG